MNALTVQFIGENWGVVTGQRRPLFCGYGPGGLLYHNQYHWATNISAIRTLRPPGLVSDWWTAGPVFEFPTGTPFPYGLDLIFPPLL